MKPQFVTIQMKATEQYLRMVLFIKFMYKMVLTVKSVCETLVYDHSNESYCTLLPCGFVYWWL